MSAVTLDDIAQDVPVDERLSSEEVIEESLQPQVNSRVNEMVNRILTAETGQGTIGDYLEHPLNFNQSKGIARILRGLTGIMGNLNLAIIDIALGVLEVSKDKKGTKTQNDVSYWGNQPT